MRRRGFLGTLAALVAAVHPLSVRPEPVEGPLTDLIKKLANGAPVKSGRVILETPRLADNGHSVPLKVRVVSPMTPADHVKSVTLLSTRNPRPVIAKFHFGPRSGLAEVSTRVRLNGTQQVIALAQLSDGTFWSAATPVEVTESACLDMS